MSKSSKDDLPIEIAQNDIYDIVTKLIDNLGDICQDTRDLEPKIDDKLIERLVPEFKDIEAINAFYRLFIKPIVGTRTAVNSIFNIIGDNGRIEEWFENSLTPYHFSIEYDRIPESIDVDRIIELAEWLKNERSHLVTIKTPQCGFAFRWDFSRWDKDNWDTVQGQRWKNTNVFVCFSVKDSGYDFFKFDPYQMTTIFLADQNNYIFNKYHDYDQFFWDGIKKGEFVRQFIDYDFIQKSILSRPAITFPHFDKVNGVYIPRRFTDDYDFKEQGLKLKKLPIAHHDFFLSPNSVYQVLMNPDILKYMYTHDYISHVGPHAAWTKDECYSLFDQYGNEIKKHRKAWNVEDTSILRMDRRKWDYNYWDNEIVSRIKSKLLLTDINYVYLLATLFLSERSRQWNGIEDYRIYRDSLSPKISVSEQSIAYLSKHVFRKDPLFHVKESSLSETTIDDPYADILIDYEEKVDNLPWDAAIWDNFESLKASYRYKFRQKENRLNFLVEEGESPFAEFQNSVQIQTNNSECGVARCSVDYCGSKIYREDLYPETITTPLQTRIDDSQFDYSTNISGVARCGQGITGILSDMFYPQTSIERFDIEEYKRNSDNKSYRIEEINVQYDEPGIDDIEIDTFNWDSLDRIVLSYPKEYSIWETLGVDDVEWDLEGWDEYPTEISGSTRFVADNPEIYYIYYNLNRNKYKYFSLEDKTYAPFEKYMYTHDYLSTSRILSHDRIKRPKSEWKEDEEEPNPVVEPETPEEPTEPEEPYSGFEYSPESVYDDLDWDSCYYDHYFVEEKEETETEEESKEEEKEGYLDSYVEITVWDSVRWDSNFFDHDTQYEWEKESDEVTPHEQNGETERPKIKRIKSGEILLWDNLNWDSSLFENDSEVLSGKYIYDVEEERVEIEKIDPYSPENNLNEFQKIEIDPDSLLITNSFPTDGVLNLPLKFQMFIWNYIDRTGAFLNEEGKNLLEQYILNTLDFLSITRFENTGLIYDPDFINKTYAQYTHQYFSFSRPRYVAQESERKPWNYKDGFSVFGRNLFDVPMVQKAYEYLGRVGKAETGRTLIGSSYEINEFFKDLTKYYPDVDSTYEIYSQMMETHNYISSNLFMFHPDLVDIQLYNDKNYLEGKEVDEEEYDPHSPFYNGEGRNLFSFDNGDWDSFVYENETELKEETETPAEPVNPEPTPEEPVTPDTPEPIEPTEPEEPEVPFIPEPITEVDKDVIGILDEESWDSFVYENEERIVYPEIEPVQEEQKPIELDPDSINIIDESSWDDFIYENDEEKTYINYEVESEEEIPLYHDFSNIDIIPIEPDTDVLNVTDSSDWDNFIYENDEEIEYPEPWIGIDFEIPVETVIVDQNATGILDEENWDSFIYENETEIVYTENGEVFDPSVPVEEIPVGINSLDTSDWDTFIYENDEEVIDIATPVVVDPVIDFDIPVVPVDIEIEEVNVTDLTLWDTFFYDHDEEIIYKELEETDSITIPNPSYNPEDPESIEPETIEVPIFDGINVWDSSDNDEFVYENEEEVIDIATPIVVDPVINFDIPVESVVTEDSEYIWDKVEWDRFIYENDEEIEYEEEVIEQYTPSITPDGDSVIAFDNSDWDLSIYENESELILEEIIVYPDIPVESVLPDEDVINISDEIEWDTFIYDSDEELPDIEEEKTITVSILDPESDEDNPVFITREIPVSDGINSYDSFDWDTFVYGNEEEIVISDSSVPDIYAEIQWDSISWEFGNYDSDAEIPEEKEEIVFTPDEEAVSTWAEVEWDEFVYEDDSEIFNIADPIIIVPVIDFDIPVISLQKEEESINLTDEIDWDEYIYENDEELLELKFPVNPEPVIEPEIPVESDIDSEIEYDSFFDSTEWDIYIYDNDTEIEYPELEVSPVIDFDIPIEPISVIDEVLNVTDEISWDTFIYDNDEEIELESHDIPIEILPEPAPVEPIEIDSESTGIYDEEIWDSFIYENETEVAYVAPVEIEQDTIVSDEEEWDNFVYDNDEEIEVETVVTPVTPEPENPDEPAPQPFIPKPVSVEENVTGVYDEETWDSYFYENDTEREIPVPQIPKSVDNWDEFDWEELIYDSEEKGQEGEQDTPVTPDPSAEEPEIPEIIDDPESVFIWDNFSWEDFVYDSNAEKGELQVTEGVQVWDNSDWDSTVIDSDEIIPDKEPEESQGEPENPEEPADNPSEPEEQGGQEPSTPEHQEQPSENPSSEEQHEEPEIPFIPVPVEDVSTYSLDNLTWDYSLFEIEEEKEQTQAEEKDSFFLDSQEWDSFEYDVYGEKNKEQGSLSDNDVSDKQNEVEGRYITKTYGRGNKDRTKLPYSFHMYTWDYINHAYAFDSVFGDNLLQQFILNTLDFLSVTRYESAELEYDPYYENKVYQNKTYTFTDFSRPRYVIQLETRNDESSYIDGFSRLGRNAFDIPYFEIIKIIDELYSIAGEAECGITVTGLELKESYERGEHSKILDLYKSDIDGSYSIYSHDMITSDYMGTGSYLHHPMIADESAYKGGKYHLETGINTSVQAWDSVDWDSSYYEQNIEVIEGEYHYETVEGKDLVDVYSPFFKSPELETSANDSRLVTETFLTKQNDNVPLRFQMLIWDYIEKSFAFEGVNGEYLNNLYQLTTFYFESLTRAKDRTKNLIQREFGLPYEESELIHEQSMQTHNYISTNLYLNHPELRDSRLYNEENYLEGEDVDTEIDIEEIIDDPYSPFYDGEVKDFFAFDSEEWDSFFYENDIELVIAPEEIEEPEPVEPITPDEPVIPEPEKPEEHNEPIPILPDTFSINTWDGIDWDEYIYENDYDITVEEEIEKELFIDFEIPVESVLPDSDVINLTDSVSWDAFIYENDEELIYSNSHVILPEEEENVINIWDSIDNDGFIYENDEEISHKSEIERIIESIEEHEENSVSLWDDDILDSIIYDNDEEVSYEVLTEDPIFDTVITVDEEGNQIVEVRANGISLDEIEWDNFIRENDEEVSYDIPDSSIPDIESFYNWDEFIWEDTLFDAYETPDIPVEPEEPVEPVTSEPDNPDIPDSQEESKIVSDFVWDEFLWGNVFFDNSVELGELVQTENVQIWDEKEWDSDIYDSEVSEPVTPSIPDITVPEETENTGDTENNEDIGIDVEKPVDEDEPVDPYTPIIEDKEEEDQFYQILFKGIDGVNWDYTDYDSEPEEKVLSEKQSQYSDNLIWDFFAYDGNESETRTDKERNPLSNNDISNKKITTDKRYITKTLERGNEDRSRLPYSFHMYIWDYIDKSVFKQEEYALTYLYSFYRSCIVNFESTDVYNPNFDNKVYQNLARSYSSFFRPRYVFQLDYRRDALEYEDGNEVLGKNVFDIPYFEMHLYGRTGSAETGITRIGLTITGQVSRELSTYYPRIDGSYEIYNYSMQGRGYASSGKFMLHPILSNNGEGIERDTSLVEKVIDVTDSTTVIEPSENTPEAKEREYQDGISVWDFLDWGEFFFDSGSELYSLVQTENVQIWDEKEWDSDIYDSDIEIRKIIVNEPEEDIEEPDIEESKNEDTSSHEVEIIDPYSPLYKDTEESIDLEKIILSLESSEWDNFFYDEFPVFYSSAKEQDIPFDSFSWDSSYYDQPASYTREVSENDLSNKEIESKDTFVTDTVAQGDVINLPFAFEGFIHNYIDKSVVETEKATATTTLSFISDVRFRYSPIIKEFDYRCRTGKAECGISELGSLFGDRIVEEVTLKAECGIAECGRAQIKEYFSEDNNEDEVAYCGLAECGIAECGHGVYENSFYITSTIRSSYKTHSKYSDYTENVPYDILHKVTYPENHEEDESEFLLKYPLFDKFEKNFERGETILRKETLLTDYTGYTYFYSLFWKMDDISIIGTTSSVYLISEMAEWGIYREIDIDSVDFANYDIDSDSSFDIEGKRKCVPMEAYTTLYEAHTHKENLAANIYQDCASVALYSSKAETRLVPSKFDIDVDNYFMPVDMDSPYFADVDTDFFVYIKELVEERNSGLVIDTSRSPIVGYIDIRNILLDDIDRLGEIDIDSLNVPDIESLATEGRDINLMDYVYKSPETDDINIIGPDVDGDNYPNARGIDIDGETEDTDNGVINDIDRDEIDIDRESDIDIDGSDIDVDSPYVDIDNLDMDVDFIPDIDIDTLKAEYDVDGRYLDVDTNAGYLVVVDSRYEAVFESTKERERSITIEMTVYQNIRYVKAA